MEEGFRVILLDQALNFINTLDPKTRTKVVYNIQRTKIVIDPELFSKLTNHIWEFRTNYNTNHIRLFAFWDTHDGALVVCTHGIFKKRQKTPSQEIEKAEKIRIQYIKLRYNEKK